MVATIKQQREKRKKTKTKNRQTVTAAAELLKCVCASRIKLLKPDDDFYSAVPGLQFVLKHKGAQ